MTIPKNVSKPQGAGGEMLTLKALGGAQVTDLRLQWSQSKKPEHEGYSLVAE